MGKEMIFETQAFTCGVSDLVDANDTSVNPEAPVTFEILPEIVDVFP